MNQTPAITRKLIITGTVLVALFGAALVLNHGNHKTVATNVSKESGKVTTTTDSASKQTVTTINGETQTAGEQNASDDPSDTASGPYYLGINSLLQRGVTTDQVDNMEDGFSYYFEKANLTPKQVSIAVDTIKATEKNQDSDQPINVLDFDTVFDSKTTIHAQMQYYGLSSMKLLLSDNTTGNQLYDSGTINTMR